MSDNITLPREVVWQLKRTLEGWANHGQWKWPESALLTCKENTEEALAALAAALAEPQPEPDALRRWVNANDDAPETEFQRGYDAARRWVREVALPALAEPEPVAWRTFDGEYDYEYRGYKYNENYAAEWLERNPGYVGWVEPLYTVPPAAATPEPATDEQIVKAGGECAVVDNEYLLDFRDGFRAAERFHGIGGSKT